jgi:histidinol-phosphate aminotransferase
LISGIFLLAAVPVGDRRLSAEAVYGALMANNVYVRWFDEDRLRDKLRISIGTPDENAQVVHALQLIV